MPMVGSASSVPTTVSSTMMLAIELRAMKPRSANMPTSVSA